MLAKKVSQEVTSPAPGINANAAAFCNKGLPLFRGIPGTCFSEEFYLISYNERINIKDCRMCYGQRHIILRNPADGTLRGTIYDDDMIDCILRESIDAKDWRYPFCQSYIAGNLKAVAV